MNIADFNPAQQAKILERANKLGAKQLRMAKILSHPITLGVLGASTGYEFGKAVASLYNLSNEKQIAPLYNKDLVSGKRFLKTNAPEIGYIGSESDLAKLDLKPKTIKLIKRIIFQPGNKTVQADIKGQPYIINSGQMINRNIIAHEIGHHLDSQVKQSIGERLKRAIAGQSVAENAAWDQASKILGKDTQGTPERDILTKRQREVDIGGRSGAVAGALIGSSALGLMTAPLIKKFISPTVVKMRTKILQKYLTRGL